MHARNTLMALSLVALAAWPTDSWAKWPKVLSVEICWNFVCNGTMATWTLKRDGTMSDQYASTGEYFTNRNIPNWPYADDFYLFYDNGQTSYWGDFTAQGLRGEMVTYHFYPPYVIQGNWCQNGC